MILNYEQQVYAGVLGKVIGVYLGRPFEGWDKKSIEEKWGSIKRYVHEDKGVPLIVADDDISGTFTFIKALSDSGLFENTPPEMFGETWLNYLLEFQTVCWWGGMSCSTEHTAFIRLKHGIKSPESGSMKLNGREVAEQIGAQIFIDAFGMVSPGNPEQAVHLAKMAAEVSHDGEAVYAAQVVAAMVSIAFVEKKMDRVLDEAIKFIPSDSVIARVHHDVRKWANIDHDWRKTYDRIDDKYGYKIWDGGCHVVPNHALMVMAWAYAKEDFFEAMRIVNTAGWDTDCNSGNVGAVSAIVCGLDHIGDKYDFQTPFADRILIPTADGTDSVTDCANVALSLARIGRKIMKAEPLPPPKDGAWHSFPFHGSIHGYMVDNSKYETRGNAVATSLPALAKFDYKSGMTISFTVGTSKFARVETPCLGKSSLEGAYSILSVPSIYHGMTMTADGFCADCTMKSAKIRMYVECISDCDNGSAEFFSEPVKIECGKKISLSWKIECEHLPVSKFGFEILSDDLVSGSVNIYSVRTSGTAEIQINESLMRRGARNIPGWISNLDKERKPFRNEDFPGATYIGNNESLGILVTGNRRWGDIDMSCKFKIHAADRAGILFRYQGMRRHYALVFTKSTVQIVKSFYGETIIAEKNFVAEEGRLYKINVSATGNLIVVRIDGKKILEAHDDALSCGGAGYCVSTGLAGFANTRISAKVI